MWQRNLILNKLLLLPKTIMKIIKFKEDGEEDSGLI